MSIAATGNVTESTAGAEGTENRELQQIERDIEGYLAKQERKELCRFVAVGSVDDGKSTLIGRLLHDTQGLYEDQLAAVKKATAKKGQAAAAAAASGQAESGDPAISVDGELEEIDFSLFTDGLKAEREQGITIDVAYRYFSTEKRKFIIADTPGHVQYTRNMATGASTADVAIILIDARLGVLPQSRRHAYIASLLGIRHLLVSVNKMDLVDWSRARFEELSKEFSAFASHLRFDSVKFFPISAKKGDNVAKPSPRMSWFDGGTLLQHLETVPLVRDRTAESFRFPVQYVIRPHLDYRGFAGQIGSGVVRRGDEVMVLPSGRKSRVKSIDTFDGSLDEAAAPLSVTVRLEDEVDCSRGDMLVHPASPPRIERRFDAMLVWLSEKPLDAGRSLLVKHAAQTVPARLERVHHRTDLETLAAVESTGLQLNDIGRVTVRTSRPLLCDAYAKNRVTGAFILIDALSNNTVAAGMILDEGAPNGQDGAVRDSGPVSEVERHARMGQKGVALFVGADAEQARSVERALFDRGHAVMIVPASEIAKDPLIEVTVRAVLAGMVVIVSGAEEAARASIADRLGAGRIVDEKSGEAKATIDRASRLASLID